MKHFFGIAILVLLSLLTFTSCINSPGTYGALSGRVILEDGLSPETVLISVAGYYDNEVYYQVYTDSNGNFKIDDVYPDTYTISYIKTNYYTVIKEAVPVGAGKSVNMETVTLRAKYGYISGTLTDEEGNPKAGAVVTVKGKGFSFTAESNENGEYSIKTRPGKYTDISIKCPDHNLQASIEATVSADKTITLDYVLPFKHNYVLEEMEESTKTTAGHRTYRCTDCNHVETVDLPKRTDGARWAGIRASSYGLAGSFGRYPGISDMAEYTGKMEDSYSGSVGTVILIVGVIGEDDRTCYLDFPISKGIKNAVGSTIDFYEDYLTALDNAGYSVWLQVEPGDADLVELAKEVMNHYKHHWCVKGFGIDVEWYKPEGTDGQGTPLDKSTAKKVLTAVRSTNQDAGYTVFIKHWKPDFLTEGEGVSGFIYIDDSQGFRPGKNSTALERMCSEFAGWAATFSTCPVMFQIGYDSDYRSDKENIWGTMDNPAKELGQAIIDECMDRHVTNDIGIIWVDFTLKEVIEKID